MDAIVRGFAVYIFLLLIFRIAGKRTLAESTNFELVLLLIISETVQGALTNGDHSVTNGFLLVMTLIGISILLSVLKQRFPTFEQWLDGVPTVIMQNGRMMRDRMDKIRVDENDILEAARRLQGLERLDQVKYAVVERSGEISIVPVNGKA
jgi:uncharacterized membrane protein YcaP (DUF421 family)